MSSALQLALTNIQRNNYVTLLTITSIVYDYVLTFSKEIEYIWMKPWTSVTALFVMVRYAGICYIIAASIAVCVQTCSIFAVYIGTQKTTIYTSNSCGIMYIASRCAFIIFIGAAHSVIILRVWVLYDRSKLILFSLLPLLSMEIIFNIVYIVMNTPPNMLDMASTVQTLNFSACSLTFPLTIIGKAAGILVMANGAVLCGFTFVQFVIQSLEIHRVTRRWELNQYSSLMIKQDIIYFILLSLYSLVILLKYAGVLPTEGWLHMLTINAQYVPAFTLTPRFIISIRELHARKLRRARGSGIDTGFGFPTLSDRGAGVSAVVFADVEHSQGPEDEIEMVQMNLRRT